MFSTEPLGGTIDLDAAEVAHIQPQRLYRLWEEGQWSALAIDFTQDAIDWRQKLTSEQRDALLWHGSMFLFGEKSVNVALAPFIAAAPHAEDKLFLSTQLADEARHHVFFDRFLREVCGIDRDTAALFEWTRTTLPRSYLRLFQRLDQLTGQLNRSPQNTSLLAQGVTLYHLVLEGLLASVGLYYLHNFTLRQQLLPGLAQGLQKIMRDESRHVAFGIQMLRRLLEMHPHCKAAVLDLLDGVLPLTGIGYIPGEKGWSYFTALGYSPQDFFATGLRFIETRLARARVNASEVLTLVKLGYPDSPVNQARRLVSYLQSGVLDSDNEVHVTEETVEAMFGAVFDLAIWSWQRRRQVNLKVQWLFSDAQPQYLLFRKGHVPLLCAGRLSRADLTLSCPITVWAGVNGEQLSLLRALVSRRLRVTGNLLLVPHLLELLPRRSKSAWWVRPFFMIECAGAWLRRRARKDKAHSEGEAQALTQKGAFNE